MDSIRPLVPARRTLPAVLAFMAALLAAACTHTPQPPPPLPAGAPAAATSPAGWPAAWVWAAGGDRWLTVGELVPQLAAADYVLLGERHDHPEHHRNQARLIGELTAAGAPARRVVFEMIHLGQSGGVRGEVRWSGGGHPVTAPDLRRVLDWDASGWPDWSLYVPVFTAALSSGAPIVAGNLPPARVRRAMGAAEPVSAAQLLAGLGAGAEEPVTDPVMAVLDPAARAAMEEDLRTAHCHPMPPRAVTKMAAIQAARDHLMARQLAAGAPGGAEAAGQSGPAILVAGNGHVQRRYGVPRHLTALAPGAKVVSVGQVEVPFGAGGPDREALARRLDEVRRAGAYDVVWFTGEHPRNDPCAGT